MAKTQEKPGRIEYNRTIGVTAMFGRGFYYPVDIVAGEDDRLYVLNRSSDGDKRGVRVTIMNLEEDYFGIFGAWGAENGQFTWPNSITMDSEQRVIISDDYLNRITVMSTDGEFIEKWGEQGSDEGQLDGPTGLTMNDDDVLVSDHRNFRIQRFSADGEFKGAFGNAGSDEGEFNMPWGISTSHDGNVLVADWGNDRIQKVTPDGEFVAAWGTSGEGEGDLHRPSSACEDEDGYVYVADWGNHRIQVFDPEGEFVQANRGQATISKWSQAFLDTNKEEAAARAEANLDLDPDLFERDANEESSHIEKYFWGPSSIRLIGDHVYVVDTVRHRIQVFDIIA